MKFGLNETTVNRINNVFAHFPPIREVIIYGSRAKGTHRAGSDVDLTAKGEGLSLEIMNKISIQLDDLLLPYFFDFSVYERIKMPELLDHIHLRGRVFYSRDKHSLLFL